MMQDYYLVMWLSCITFALLLLKEIPFYWYLLVNPFAYVYGWILDVLGSYRC